MKSNQTAAHFLDPCASSMEGSALSDSDAIAWVQGMALDRPVCLVRDWIWYDIDIPSHVCAQFQREGLNPSIVFSRNVIFDSANRVPLKGWVRTSLLVNYRDHLFRTRNTVYVLVGNGQRRLSRPSDLPH